MSQYLKEAQWIYDLIKDRYTDSDGMLMYQINSFSGEIVDHRILVSDFGDYIQNFYYLGVLTGRNDICQWSQQHLIQASKRYQDDSGFFVTEKGKNKVMIWDNADTFEGLATFFHLSKEKEIYEIVKKFISGIQKKKNRKGIIPESFTGIIHSPFARSEYIGNFTEELVLLAHETGEKQYMKLAEQLVAPWVECSYFKEIGLIPNRLMCYSAAHYALALPLLTLKNNPFKRSTLVKANTNLLSGILQLWNFAPEAERPKYKAIIDHWKNGVEKHCATDGYYFGKYNAVNKTRSEYRRPLPDNHHVLAFYADVFHFCRDPEYLLLLEKGCNFWLQNQQETGFFPESPVQQKGDNPKRAIMDSNLDLSIVFLKAFSLTGKKTYFTAAKQCLDAIVKYMKRDYGYIEMVHVHNGELYLQPQFSYQEHGDFFTKYLTLFIKGLLLLHEVLQGNDIYRQDLFLLARDR
ncbi:MAG: hypothetical protein HQM14_19285 [SAR324 cluster bacterium]|nr:hypothetical protein [SAR324 cluster bacterium]